MHRRSTLAARALLALLISTTATAQEAAPDDPRDTADVLEAFAAHYEQSVNGREAGAINRCFDLPSLLDRAYTGLEGGVPDAFRRGFENGVRKSFSWGHSIAAGLGANGHYRLMRFDRTEGGARGLYRMITEQGGLNYHDVHFGRGSEGQPAVVDIHVHITGEKLSETLRRSVRQGLRSVEEDDHTILESFRRVKQMAVLIQQGQFEQALAVYDTLPEDMQRDKTVLVMRVTAAARVGPARTEAAAGAFRKLFPDDPCVDLVTLDQLVFAERWDDALAALDRLRASITDDPYLDVLAANMELARVQTDAARRFANRARQREPDSDEPVWCLLGAALLDRNHAETVRWLTTLELEFGFVFDDLAGLSEYAEFVASEPYQTWRATHAAAESGL